MTDAGGQKRFGAVRWKLLRKRLAGLAAAPTLRDMRGVAGFHQLTGDRAGRFALKLDGAYRLVVEPANHPVPKLDDGGIDEGSITGVRVVEVVNYHD
jgi:plasmid maintenance system killer protein